VSHGVTLKSQSICGRKPLKTCLAHGGIRFRDWFWLLVWLLIGVADLVKFGRRLRGKFVSVYLCVEFFRTYPLLICTDRKIVEEICSVIRAE
jgi:hypothetical protein